MNASITRILMSCCLLCISIQGRGSNNLMDKFSHTEVINETMKFEKPQVGNKLTVFNVYGSVEAEGHAGDEILIEATREVFAKTQALVDEGAAEIGLKLEQVGNHIYVYLDSPYTHFEPESGEIWHSDTCWRRDDCSRKHRERKKYKYHLDIKIKLPQHLNVQLSTINNGHILVTGLHTQKLTVNNINGGIDMTDVSGQTVVNALNKDINITYSENPKSDSSFESLNGDLNINFADQPNAEVVYQTMNGELYTAFAVHALTPVVKRTAKQKKHGIQYKLDAENRFKLGDGGPVYRFETLNGDIKIK